MCLNTFLMCKAELKWLDFPINVEIKLIYDKYNPIIIPFIISKAVYPDKHVPIFDVTVN